MATQKNIYKNMHSTSRILGQMFKTFVFDFSFDKCIPNVSREFFNIFLCFFLSSYTKYSRESIREVVMPVVY